MGAVLDGSRCRGPAYFVRELLDLNELRALDRPHVSVDVAQFDRAAPVVQVEASTYGTPVQWSRTSLG